ncbi:PucR family transcriptional regulator [Kutzneria albida]|uniref:PucR C-terminal helix-turn-helix domain-containing protein n=1 Tax=Kutzneria albida DSM 43870 TaxID=1449976 RepID=W5WER8_9PSEU|nr:helix-turn-helix domain-containing protein [Kutzneria albida]AHH99096.1 hypothetical protein KALB_5735 [Kutzneria albida DSM 43870]
MSESGVRRHLAERYLPVQQLVRDVGPALLRLVQEGAGFDEPLTEIAIYAPGAPTQLGPGCVVLGIGVTTEAELLELAAAMDRADARVLAVKAPLPPSVGGGKLTIIEVNQNASWMHVATTVREQLLEYARARVRSDDSGSELFTLANAIYTALGAPVTIEDRFSALVAWSEGQDRTDAERIETILGRAVHQRTLAEQRERGEFVRLHASGDPVYLEATEPDQLPRVAIAVRAGSDVLGYIWAVVTKPLDEASTARLREFASIVALRLVGLRTETSYARQQRGELAAAVLGGSADRVEASRLQLGSGPVCVLAAAPRLFETEDSDAATDAVTAGELRRFAETLEYFLAAVHPRSASVAGTGAVYALVAWPPEHTTALEATVNLARDFLARTPLAGNYVVAVGGPADSLGQIAEVRAQADAALRALRHPTAHGPAVRTVADMALSVLLLHLADVTESLGLPDSTGALHRLCQHDGQDGLLTATLATYLDAAGATDIAAAALHIHANTMRYRLRRIREVSGLDFTNADAMLLAHLQLRVRALRRAQA